MLFELIKIDREYRWQNGDRRSIGNYLDQFPELATGGNLNDLVLEVNRVRALAEDTIGPSSDTPRQVSGCKPSTASADSPHLDDADPSPGSFGSYELVEEVGRGGFARVYRARDTKPGREVAIKIPRTELMALRETRERILREARAAARLRHPVIVPIHEVVEHDDNLFIVFEFVRGTTLAAEFAQTSPAPQ